MYSVVHRDHRDPHEVTLNANETFPVCRQCGKRVRFRLVALAEVMNNKISDDQEFGNPV